MKKYYQTLNKDRKLEIQKMYKQEYAKSELNLRLTRLKIYAAIGYFVAIVILVYAFLYEDKSITSILMGFILIAIATVYLVGAHMIKINVLNKIALKNK